MRYTSDLTDAEWQLIHYCFPKPCKTGRPREHSYRELLNAIFYLSKTACQWRNLPEHFAPWGTVYHYFRQWKRTGLWASIHGHLREHLRTVAGRKRHLLVDTMGLVLLALVLPANIQDRDGARQLLARFFGQPARPRVKHIWADGGYAGALLDWARQVWRCTVEIVKRSDWHTFRVLPRRWVVERTFGWLGRYRRLNRDYERQAQTGEVMVYLAMIRLMLARLARN